MLNICCFHVGYIAARILRTPNILISTLKQQSVLYVEQTMFLRQLCCDQNSTFNQGIDLNIEQTVSMRR